MENTTLQAPAVIEPLVLADRCDVDDVAQAFVVALSPAGLPLKFCAHHYNEHEPRLAMTGWKVVEDIRNTINLKPSDNKEPAGEFADAD